jgi:hypothetical protein
MKGRLIIAGVLALLLGASAAPGWAASLPATRKAPSPNATIGPKTVIARWQGLVYRGEKIAGPEGCSPSRDPSNNRCDHFLVKSAGTREYWAANAGGMVVGISWPKRRDDFDLYVFSGTKQVAASRHRATRSERVFVPNAIGVYEVRVVPAKVTKSGYTGAADFIAMSGGSLLAADSTPSGGGDLSGLSIPAAGPSPSPAPGEGPEAPQPCQGTFCFDYGKNDQFGWYWAKQIDQEVGPIGPVDQRVHLQNPQQDNTLPVAVERGEEEKVSVVAFDLSQRGVPLGSTVTKFVVTIAQGSGQQAGGEFPSFNDQDKVVQACKVITAWSTSKASLYELKPGVDEGSCVNGERNEDPLNPAWTFDLTAMAADWGIDPIANQGVEFRGLLPQQATPDQTWQANLKIPAQDDPATPVNEYEGSQNNTHVDMAYAPPAVSPGAPLAGSSGSAGSGYFSGTSGGGTFDAGGGDQSFATGSGTGQNSTRIPQTVSQRPAAAPSLPRLPWYVWLLIPPSLIALLGVRSVLWESGGVGRPDGVIAAIRARNGTTTAPGDGAQRSAETSPSAAGGLRGLLRGLTMPLRKR